MTMLLALALFSVVNADNSVVVCHNGNDLNVAFSALQAHLDHGDQLGGCGDCIDESLINFDIGCIAVYDPVCGCDGITYSNGCVATYKNGVTSYTSGECACIDPALIDPDIICALIFDPVCGCDGETYSNPCFAGGAGVTSYTAGECGGTIIIGKKENETNNVLAQRTSTILVAYPNPFTGSTNLTFNVGTNGKTTLTIYDVAGAKVGSIFEGNAEAGKSYQVQFNANALAKGIYFAKLTDANGKISFQKLFLMK